MSWPTLESLISESSEPPRWLVRDFLYQSSLICIAGVPGVGKSVLAYSLAISVASGKPFLDLPVAQGRVLYFDEENGPANMPTYFRWAWKGSDCPHLPSLGDTLRMGQHSILSHPGPWFELCLSQAHDFRPSLIIFDTSSSCFKIQDENDNAEASRIISYLRAIQSAAASSTTIVVLRHARIDHDPLDFSTRHKMRGASAWAGQSDGVVFHLAPPGNFKSLRRTYLLPEKTRAYGLRDRLNILPSWTLDDPALRGIKLAGTFGELNS